MNKIDEILKKLFDKTLRFDGYCLDNIAQAKSELLDYFKSLVGEKKELETCSKEAGTYMSYELGFNRAIDTINRKIEEERNVL